jgi:ABC-type metal ion transport system substrate-binding protein
MQRACCRLLGEIGRKMNADNLPAGIYSLSGKRLQEMQKGFNIVVSEDGTARKVLKQ